LNITIAIDVSIFCFSSTHYCINNYLIISLREVNHTRSCVYNSCISRSCSLAFCLFIVSVEKEIVIPYGPPLVISFRNTVRILVIVFKLIMAEVNTCIVICGLRIYCLVNVPAENLISYQILVFHRLKNCRSIFRISRG
jgi:hypothetical protein